MKGPFVYDDLPPQVRALLKFAPEYALRAAYEAVQQAAALRQEGTLRPGAYYLVLADLVGSTHFTEVFGNEAGNTRIKRFVDVCTSRLADESNENEALFLKEVGDAVLLLFRHFPDVLRWQQRVAGELESGDIQFRTVVNLGEVTFDGSNPLALSVNQLFKIEKDFGAGQVGLADFTFKVAAPSVDNVQLRVVEVASTEIPGVSGPVQLYALDAAPLPEALVAEWEAENEDRLREERET